MTPVSQLRGPSREHLAWPFFDSRHSEYAAALDAFAAGLCDTHSGDVDETCRSLVRRLGAAGLLEASVAGNQPDAVIDSLIGVSVPNLSGGYSAMLPNHHITKPVLIGEIQGDGQFNTVWETSGLVPGDEWSDYLDGSKDLISDWRAPLSCGNFNAKTGKCMGTVTQ